MIRSIKAAVISALILSCVFVGTVGAFSPIEQAVDNTSNVSLVDGPDGFTPEELHVVTVDNLHVTYIESGTGRTVVLLHGNAGGIEDFEYGAMESLAREYRVVAIDRPGHGSSDRPAGEAGSVEYQAEFLHQTLAN